MIIFIEDEAVDLSFEKHRFALENILLSHFNGNCFVFTKSRSLIDSVIKSANISERAKKAALDIKEKMAFSLNLISGSLAYMKTSGIGEAKPISTQYGWYANINFFEDSDFIEKPIFIGESLKDIDLYRFSGEHFLLREKFNRQLNIKFRPVPGGGGSTCDVLKECVSTTKVPVFCVVDSDKRSPGGDIKATAREALRVDLEREINVVYVLPVRAAENTIPKQILINVFGSNKTYIENHFDDPNDIPFGFANLKCKNTLRMIWGATEENVKSEWLDWVARKSIKVRDQCLNNSECEGESCSCYLTPSFSVNCLDRVSQYLKENSLHKTATESNLSINDVWINIGEMVASFFSCSKGVRVS